MSSFSAGQQVAYGVRSTLGNRREGFGPRDTQLTLKFLAFEYKFTHRVDGYIASATTHFTVGWQQIRGLRTRGSS